MKVTVFACGPAANESEVLAVERLKQQLAGAPGADHWILLTNLAFSVNHQFQSDEIDIVVIGPPGVRVIEVKHWSPGWVDARPDIAQAEADKVTNKARKIGTTLRRVASDLPRVDGVFLLTQPASKAKRLAGQAVRGVAFHTLNQWKDAIGFVGPRVLSSSQVSALGQALAPKIPVAIDGSLRRLAGYVNLELPPHCAFAQESAFLHTRGATCFSVPKNSICRRPATVADIGRADGEKWQRR